MSEQPPSWSAPDGSASEPTSAPPPPPPPGHGYGYGYGPSTHQPGVIPLRPLALGELLDGAIKIIRRYPRPTLGLSAAIAVVVTVLNVGAVLLLHLDLRTPRSTDNLNDSLALNISGSAVPQLVAFLAGLVLTGALITVVGKAVQGKPVATDEVWEAVRPRILPLLGLALLTGLIVVVPTGVGFGLAAVIGIALGVSGLLLAVPLALASIALGVFLYVRFALAPAALVLEKAGVIESLRRSAVLIKSSWWRSFGVLLLTWIISLIVGAIISGVAIIPAAIVSTSGSTGFLVSQQVAGGIASVILAPFSAGVRALLYVDRRMRAEGLDVALQAAVGEGSTG